MNIACLDLEGVLIPEIWIHFAEKTKIKELSLTTRDIPDYDVLMKQRLKLLHDNNLKLKDIQEVIATMEPLPGAKEFMDWLRTEFQVIILSDTYYEFAAPLMKQLGSPTLFCHSLEMAADGSVVNYHLRLRDQKKHSVEALRNLNFKVIAAGDSYNDTSMLQAAHQGIFFRPPPAIQKEFPQFPVTTTYDELKSHFQKFQRDLS